MTKKVSVFIATSLDGYIARDDGSIDWLNDTNKKVPENEDCGYQIFIDTVDIIILGRITFEQVITFPQWPYSGKSVFVLSTNQNIVPKRLLNSAKLVSGHPSDIIHSLSKTPNTHFYIDGGITIQGFLSEGLVDEITITRIPVILGSGRPLFGKIHNDIVLEHIETKAYSFGYVQSKYKILQ